MNITATTNSPSLLLALTAGLVSFLTPCIFPLIPSYISYIGGVSYGDLKEGKGKRFSILVKTLLFVLGFTIVFSIFSLFTTGIGSRLSQAIPLINKIAGGIVIVLGLNFIFDFIKILNFEKKFHFKKRPGGYLGSVLIGVAFGAGWTPCIGPILSTILISAMGSDSLTGVLLLAAYSAGLGIPFILAGLFFSTFSKLMDKVKPHLHAIKIFSGLFLIFMGILIALGRMSLLNQQLGYLALDLGIWQKENPRGVATAFGFIFLVPALLILLFYFFRIRKNRKSDTPRLIYPGRIFFFLFFLFLSLSAFLEQVDFVQVFNSWFNFEGLRL